MDTNTLITTDGAMIVNTKYISNILNVSTSAIYTDQRLGRLPDPMCTIGKVKYWNMQTIYKVYPTNERIRTDLYKKCCSSTLSTCDDQEIK